VLSPLQDPDQRLVVYRAADPDSQVVLDVIAARARDRKPPAVLALQS
jgi:hypothetical protein